MKFPSLIPEWEVPTREYKGLKSLLKGTGYLKQDENARYVKALEERIGHYFGMFLLTSGAITVAILWDLIARSI